MNTILLFGVMSEMNALQVSHEHRVSVVRASRKGLKKNVKPKQPDDAVGPSIFLACASDIEARRKENSDISQEM